MKGSLKTQMRDEVVTEMKEAMLKYLQSVMDDFKREEARYGLEDRVVRDKLVGALACRQMAEVLIREPVNLGLDGKVTVGF